MPISKMPRRFAQVIVFVEKYVLSLLFLYFGIEQATAVHADAEFPALVNHLLRGVLQLVAGIALLCNSAPKRLPADLAEIVVPLLGSYFYLLYNFAAALPLPMQQMLGPQSWRVPLAAIALAMSSAGLAIAVWAALTLGRSFGVVVAVREIVRRGPYRYVRHPIYLGYLLHIASLWLAMPSAGMALLVAGHALLTLWRARLEEAGLSAHSDEYRQYAHRTGFLLPQPFTHNATPSPDRAGPRSRRG